MGLLRMPVLHPGLPKHLQIKFFFKDMLLGNDDFCGNFLKGAGTGAIFALEHQGLLSCIGKFYARAHI